MANYRIPRRLGGKGVEVELRLLHVFDNRQARMLSKTAIMEAWTYKCMAFWNCERAKQLMSTSCVLYYRTADSSLGAIILGDRTLNRDFWARTRG